MRTLRNSAPDAQDSEASCAHGSELTCWCCEERIEVHSPALRELQSSLAAKHGFQLLHPVHEITGLCPACRCDMGSDRAES